jgi:hypothetical protein
MTVAVVALTGLRRPLGSVRRDQPVGDGYALGNLLTSLIAGVVVFVTLTVLGVPFPLIWALWVAWSIFCPWSAAPAGRSGTEGSDVRFT